MTARVLPSVLSRGLRFPITGNKRQAAPGLRAWRFSWEALPSPWLLLVTAKPGPLSLEGSQGVLGGPRLSSPLHRFGGDLGKGDCSALLWKPERLQLESCHQGLRGIWVEQGGRRPLPILLTLHHSKIVSEQNTSLCASAGTGLTLIHHIFSVHVFSSGPELRVLPQYPPEGDRRCSPSLCCPLVPFW